MITLPSIRELGLLASERADCMSPSLGHSVASTHDAYTQRSVGSGDYDSSPQYPPGQASSHFTARWFVAFCFQAGSLTNAAPTHAILQQGNLVFSHFIIGIVGDRTSAADYDVDMQRAKTISIDAFALNIGVDPYTDTQLGYAYDSAYANDAAKVGQLIGKYGTKPGQLLVDGKVFASSFAGDGLDVATMRASAGVEVFWAPNFHPELTPDPKDIDAALNWMGWDSNGNNKAPNAAGTVTVAEGECRRRHTAAL